MKPNHLYGFTLIECMLANLLFALLLSAIVITYQITLRTHEKITYLLQEMREANFALHYLDFRLRMAGLHNCLNKQDTISLPITGYPTGFMPAIDHKTNTDIIVISQCLWYQEKRQYLHLAYFIGATTRKNKKGQIIYALFEKPLNGNRLELIENVSDFSVQFGILNQERNAIVYYIHPNDLKKDEVVGSVFFRLQFSSTQQSNEHPWFSYVALRENIAT